MHREHEERQLPTLTFDVVQNDRSHTTPGSTFLGFFIPATLERNTALWHDQQHAAHCVPQRKRKHRRTYSYIHSLSMKRWTGLHLIQLFSVKHAHCMRPLRPTSASLICDGWQPAVTTSRPLSRASMVFQRKCRQWSACSRSYLRRVRMNALRGLPI